MQASGKHVHALALFGINAQDLVARCTSTQALRMSYATTHNLLCHRGTVVRNLLHVCISPGISCIISVPLLVASMLRFLLIPWDWKANCLEMSLLSSSRVMFFET